MRFQGGIAFGGGPARSISSDKSIVLQIYTHQHAQVFHCKTRNMTRTSKHWADGPFELIPVSIMGYKASIYSTSFTEVSSLVLGPCLSRRLTGPISQENR